MFKPFKSRLIASTLLGAALLASSGARAVPVSAWELATVSGNWSDSWSFGDLFTVGSSNITVSSLGALDVGLDGFKSNGILVGLYRESDQALLASTALNSSNGLVGNYRFASIADVQLQANTAYRVVAVNGDDDYNTALGSPVAVDPRITWNGYGYCRSAALSFCNANMGSERTWMANFRLDDDSSGGKVPEPSSLALLGLGLLALVARKARSPAA